MITQIPTASGRLSTLQYWTCILFMRRTFSSKITLRDLLAFCSHLYKPRKFYLILARSPKHLVLSVHRRKASVSVHLDCKTVRIFAYSSTHEQSNKRCGTRLKTESETGERRACEARVVRARKTLTPRFTDFFTDLILRKKTTVLQSTVHWKERKLAFLCFQSPIG